MRDLDREIKKGSGQKHNLDDVMSVLSRQDQKITITDLANAVSELLPTGSKVLDAAGLDNCTS